MTDKSISPLRRRMIEDMTIRKLAPTTQASYVRAVRNFTAFLGRSPDRATAEDLRRYQLQLASSGVSGPGINATVTALRFFFTVTLGRGAVTEKLTSVREPRRLPVVLSPGEVARLLEAAPGLKYQAALSVAYGAGLRASEVISLKIADIDSDRMIIRVEQGKGGQGPLRDAVAASPPSAAELVAGSTAARLAVSRPGPGQSPDHAPAQSRLPCGCRGRRYRQAGLAAYAAS